MTNLPNERQNNLVSFLRENKPLPPAPQPDLEQRLFQSLEPRTTHHKYIFKAAWKIPSAIATGFLFTSVSFGWKTPRIALEPKDLENFLVKNWQNTLESSELSANETMESQWLLPMVTESNSTLSISAQ